MKDVKFQALVVTKTEDGRFLRSVRTRRVSDLPPGQVLIQVHYSSLNYKDALSATGHRGVTRHYPHTPGIDAAGTVVVDESGTFSAGDAVVVIGYDLGMNTPGGFGQMIRVPVGWVVPLPETLSTRESMIYGTAGFTAAMAVDRLIKHGIKCEDGELLVTGATGGVGSMAVALLSQLGYQPVAATGKTERQDFLVKLGATRIIGRQEVVDGHERPIMSARWAGAIDNVGGPMLDATLKSTDQDGAVAVCGNVASSELNTTVYPFILRGISIYGIDSASFDLGERIRLWSKLAGEWKLDKLDAIKTERALDKLDPEIDKILKGQQVGRVIVRLI